MGRLLVVKNFEEYITEQESNEIFVPKTVRKYVDMALKKEIFFDKIAREDLEQ